MDDDAADCGGAYECVCEYIGDVGCIFKGDVGRMEYVFVTRGVIAEGGRYDLVERGDTGASRM